MAPEEDFEENFLESLMESPDWLAEAMPFDLLAKRADRAVTVSALLNWIAEYDIGGRKSFCDAVGISESTLSNWIKEDRLPTMAKIVVALYALYKFGERVSDQLTRRMRNAATGDRLVLDGDSYVIVSFDSSRIDMADNVNGVGRIVARNIESREVGERLLSYQKMRVVLELAQAAIKPLPETRFNDHIRYLIDEFVDTPEPRYPKSHPSSTSELPEGDVAETLKRLSDDVEGGSNA